MSQKFFNFAITIIASIMILGAFPKEALSKFIGPDKSTQYNTVKDVLDHPIDDVKVHLKGKITSKITWNRYTFKDSTGEITVKIKPKKLAHVDITPDSEVEIFGDIEVKFLASAVEIEVDHLNALSGGVNVPGGYHSQPKPAAH